MNRSEAEDLINGPLYGAPTFSGEEAQAVEAALTVLRKMGLAAFSDEGIARLLDEQMEIFTAEMRR